MESQKLHTPLTEKLKGLPGLFGLHLNEMPEFKVIKRDQAIELREYAPMIIAKTSVKGTGEEARNEAFIKLAGYIFGHNREEKTLAMTSPVILQNEIANRTTMSFILPAKLTGKTAPLPSEEGIHLQEIPVETWACLSYSGKNTREEIAGHRNELESWLILHEYPVDSRTFRIAQYDAPATISFLRRNEVRFRIYGAEL